VSAVGVSPIQAANWCQDRLGLEGTLPGGEEPNDLVRW